MTKPEGTHAKEVLKKLDPGPVQFVPEPNRYLSMIERVVMDPNINLDRLQKIIDMKNDEEDREKRQAFNRDMVLAQADIEVVVKNKENLQTRSRYSDLGAIIKASKPHYTKHGFSISFSQGEGPDGYIRVLADIMHRDGYTKQVHKDVPVDSTGIAGKVNKTRVHAEASSFSYGKRYIICDTFAIPTGDDDDGNAASIEFVTGKDLAALKKLVKETDSDNEAFLSVADAESLETIPVSNYEKCMAALRKKKAVLEKQAMREPGCDDE